MVLEKLIELLCEQLDIEADEVNENTDIVNDLGADSLDVVDLVMTLEDEFDIEIPDEDIEKIQPSASWPIIWRSTSTADPSRKGRKRQRPPGMLPLCFSCKKAQIGS